MAIMLNNQAGDNQLWADVLASYLPELDIHVYPNVPDKTLVHYAVVWNHPHGDLLTYPNLKAVLVLGAGMDHIDKEPALPKAPIVRLVDPAVGDEMSQYVLYWCMHFQRNYERYRQQAAQRVWQRHMTPLSQNYRVTVLGAGEIGAFIAQRLATTGFAAQSWNRSAKLIDGVSCFHGDDGLIDVLSQTDVLVNCLPLKPATKHFINAERLALLPKGSSIINLSRGAVIDDQALLKALDSKQISNAALDTFVNEPLSQASEYWDYDNVYITPHMSGSTYPKLAAKVISDNIKRVEAGELPFPIYTPT